MEFYKLEATGNDFIITILDDVNNLNIKQLCDRHKGIGADGLINIDSYYNVSFYNADGSNANMCGNGLRCVSKLLYYLTKKKDNTIYINSKETYLKQVKDNISCITMPSLFMVKQDDYYLVNVSNQHMIVLTNDAINYEFNQHQISYSNKNKCNITALEILDRRNIKIKTFEYGVGITKSCGSASMASFYVGYMLDKVDSKVNVHQMGGTTICEYKDGKYYLSGEVNLIYKGEFYGND